MATTKVTITIDAGVLADAQAVADALGMSVSAWISECTRRETFRTAMKNHADWCAAQGLTGEPHDAGRAELVAGAQAEMHRLAQTRHGRDAA
jgi:hypothetical protein